MKVSELIEKLSKVSQDAEVAVYCQMSEDSDKASDVKVYNKENGPYNKGDDVWDIYDINENIEIVFIQ